MPFVSEIAQSSDRDLEMGTPSIDSNINSSISMVISLESFYHCKLPQVDDLSNGLQNLQVCDKGITIS